MRRLLIAFVFGAAAIAALEVCALLALTLTADGNGWESFRIAAGSLVLVEFERTADATTTSLGAAAVVLVVAGGALNACGTAVLVRRE